MIISNPPIDGYGAQILSKLSCYVFCHYYKLPYSYTPITKYHHTKENDLDSLFKITSNNFNSYNPSSNNKKFICINGSECKDLNIFKKIIENKDNNYKIQQCHWFLEQNPDIYYNETVLNELRNIYYKTNKNHSNLFNKLKNNNKIFSIHIRRNDISASKHNTRFIELYKYENFIKYINENYTNTNIIIYTDSKNNELNKLKSNNVFLNKCSVKETFHDFVESDFLLVSISSFSYVPALLNKGTIYFFENSMFKGLNNWNKLP